MSIAKAAKAAHTKWEASVSGKLQQAVPSIRVAPFKPVVRGMPYANIVTKQQEAQAREIAALKKQLQELKKGEVRTAAPKEDEQEEQDERAQLRVELDKLDFLGPDHVEVRQRKQRLDELKAARPFNTRVLDAGRREQRLQKRCASKQAEMEVLQQSLLAQGAKLETARCELASALAELDEVHNEQQRLATSAVESRAAAVAPAMPARQAVESEADLQWVQSRILDLAQAGLDDAAFKVVEAAMRQAHSDRVQQEHQKAALAAASGSATSRSVVGLLPRTHCRQQLLRRGNGMR